MTSTSTTRTKSLNGGRGLASRSTFAAGIGTLRLARAVAFDHIHISSAGHARVASREDRIPFNGVLIRIDPPATSAEITVMLNDRVELLDLAVIPVAADQSGSGVPRIEIPFDG